MTKFSKATRTDVYNVNQLGLISAWSDLVHGFMFFHRYQISNSVLVPSGFEPCMY